MTGAWHLAWQARFPLKHREVLFRAPKTPNDDATTSPYCDRRADAVVPDGRMVIEFQHSSITAEEVRARHRDYVLGHAKKLVWIVHGERVRDLLVSRSVLLCFDAQPWKYQAFLDSNTPYVYYDCGEVIYRARPDAVRSHMVHVRRGVPKEAFVDALIRSKDDGHDHEALWSFEDEEGALPQCTLYHNQRGAGCGKTYESIQLLAGRDERFTHVRQFVYLTKLHCAKYTIYDEFLTQMRQGNLGNVHEPESTTDDPQSHIRGRQYRIQVRRAADDADISITIGTIDSFMYALGDKRSARQQGGDFFAQLRASIAAGFRAYNDSGVVRYAQEFIRLNRECLVIVDEAQDLERSYVESLAAIMRDTFIDVYLIGDKLQSIWRPDNVFTHLLSGDGLPETHTVFNTGSNVVRRFHSRVLADFVNHVVDFDAYDLPRITGICAGGDSCPYSHDQGAVLPFVQPKIDNDEVKLLDAVDVILRRVKEEVDTHSLLPHQFMFIFPIMKGNVLAETLEEALTDFWIKRFQDVEYQSRVLAADHYWGARVNDGRFYRHAVLHKSDEDKPINLDESRRSTRLLSIHASKGLGSEVVFLLDMSENNLRLFSKDYSSATASTVTKSIVYESLLHVAVTRQKLRLHLGIPRMEGDDIRLRFLRGVADVPVDTSGDFEFREKTAVKIDQIRSFAGGSPEWSNALYEAYFSPRGLRDLLPEESPSRGDIIEWGHHVVRYHVMAYSLMCNIYNRGGAGRGKDSNVKQIFAITRGFADAEVYPLEPREYRRELMVINRKNREGQQYRALPLLRFTAARDTRHQEYKEYCNALTEIVSRVQQKLKYAAARSSSLPHDSLCPLEMCVLVHALQVRQHGLFAEFSAMEVYDIMHSMRTAGALSPDLHDNGGCWGCVCSQTCLGRQVPPTTEGESEDEERAKQLRKSVTEHYSIITRIDAMYNAFEFHLRERVHDRGVIRTFLIQHSLVFGGERDPFKILDPSVNGIAVTDTNVILFMLKPSFNRLSCDDLFVHALVNTLLAMRTSSEKNAALFRDKKVLVCVFTFSSAQPVWLDLHLDAGEETKLVEFIRAVLMQRFRSTNDKIWRLWQSCIASESTVERALKLVLEKLAAYKAPAYACEYFRGVQKLKLKFSQVEITCESIQEDFEVTLDAWLSGLTG